MEGGGAAQDGARAMHFRQHEGGRGAEGVYSYQLFKHIPLHTETLQSEDRKKKKKKHTH